MWFHEFFHATFSKFTTISVSGGWVFILKTCRIVASASMIHQFHEFLKFIWADFCNLVQLWVGAVVRRSAPPPPRTRHRSQVTAVLSLFGSDCRALRPLLALIDTSSGGAPHATKGLSPLLRRKILAFSMRLLASIVMHGPHCSRTENQCIKLREEPKLSNNKFV